MPRGGRRPGAGRKPGSTSKAKAQLIERVVARGMTPLDIILESARKLFEAQKYSEASLAAQRAAPFVHQKFAPTSLPAKLHPEQVLQGDLFDLPQPAPEGKKAEADAAAADALKDPFWGDLLNRQKSN